MLINKLFTTSVKTKMKLNLMWPWTLLLKILWHYIKTIFTLLSHEKFIFHLTQSSEKADARHDLFWLKSKIRLSIYLNKKPTCAQIWQLLFFFFLEKNYTIMIRSHKHVISYANKLMEAQNSPFFRFSFKHSHFGQTCNLFIFEIWAWQNME